ncbi:heme-binding protein [Granulosicoccus antarcticus]|nr:heme-binding protein [Granulosicoccus antarcticus]
MATLRKLSLTMTAMLLTIVVSSCSEGTPSGDPSGADSTVGCDGSCFESGEFLTIADVEQVIAQSVQEALARNVNATIGVVDRVGNVLGVYRMGEREERFVVLSTDFTDTDGIIDAVADQTFAVTGGLEGIKLPLPDDSGAGTFAPFNLDHLAAISKAITGAYLSSEGNAFTSRTANQIVQEHFNPGEDFQPGGPLFGVQFSQFGCSDFTPFQQDDQIAAGTFAVGPRPSPLGLAADPGGLPLYKNGAVVGGIGVMADSIYGIDKFVADIDADIDETIAIAGTFGFGAPLDRRDRITVEGKVFRYADADFNNLMTNPIQAPALSTNDADVGALIAVRGFTNGDLKEGTVFGQPDSGIRASDGVSTGENFDNELDAFIFVDENNQPRFPPVDSTDPTLTAEQRLSSADVASILSNALDVANRARAQIRRPLGTPARVTISVVDTRGEVLGMIRGRDAPIFGADVSLQKARTSAFFSSPDAADYFQAPSLNNPDGADATSGFPLVTYIQPGPTLGTPLLVESNITDYVTAAQSFIGPTALADGAFAFSDRAGGNLSRPFFPDGINGTDPGPFSKPPGEWSVFSTGLQLDLAYNALLTGVVFAAANSPDGVSTEPEDLSAGAPRPPFAGGCAGKGLNILGRPQVSEVSDSRLANGLQIFPGSVPIYRDDTLIGAIGVSGDGVDQDDMISFLGVNNAGLEVGGFGNAPMSMRADQLTPKDVRLRFVQCPQSPFIDSMEDNVCAGL